LVVLPSNLLFHYTACPMITNLHAGRRDAKDNHAIMRSINQSIPHQPNSI
jgi:hypothetical protein